MHHECLFQSISARKATHIKLGTCRVALNASYNMVLKWCRSDEVAVKGCLLNEKMRIFRFNPPLAPSVNILLLLLTTC